MSDQKFNSNEPKLILSHSFLFRRRRIADVAQWQSYG